jgi:predicted transcriptional regulator
MKTVHDWLASETARDVMTREVAVLGPDDHVADAVDLFLRDQISGAPVVDEQGVCLGVLSATDIVSFEERRANVQVQTTERRRRRPFDGWQCGEQWWHDFGHTRDRLQPHMEEKVTRYMTRDIVSVNEDAPLGIVVRCMIDAHVHRVLVLDGARRLRGIITTMDVLAAAVRAGRG